MGLGTVRVSKVSRFSRVRIRVTNRVMVIVSVRIRVSNRSGVSSRPTAVQ